MNHMNANNDNATAGAAARDPRRLVLALAATVALAALTLLAACGGGDDSSASPTPTASGATAAPSTAATQTPAGTTPEPDTGTPTPTPGESFAPNCAAIGLTSHLDLGTGQFTLGQPVPIMMTIKNCGNNVNTLFFRTSQRYEFYIQNDTGIEVWRYSDGKTFDQAVGQDQLAVGEERTYGETWDQKDSRSRQVPAGRYKVFAFSIGCADAASTNCTFGPVSYISVTES